MNMVNLFFWSAFSFKALFFKMKQLLIFEYRLFSKQQNSVVCHLMLIDPVRDRRQTALMNGCGAENAVSFGLKLRS